jgi:hypothetical protein
MSNLVLKINGRYFFFGFLVLLLCGAVFASWNYATTPDGQYHGANEIWVNTSDGGEMNLQEAIDGGFIVDLDAVTSEVISRMPEDEDMIVNEEHSMLDCISEGGMVYPVNEDGNSYLICKFQGSSCPAGWTQFESWSETRAEVCGEYQESTGGSFGRPECNTCNTGRHSFSNNSNIESCFGQKPQGKYGMWCESVRCYATVTAVGCY